MAPVSPSGDEEIPLDYQWIQWEKLYSYVGRALIGDHVPRMTTRVAEYLERQAKDMRMRADKMDLAAKALRGSTEKKGAT